MVAPKGTGLSLTRYRTGGAWS